MPKGQSLHSSRFSNTLSFSFWGRAQTQLFSLWKMQNNRFSKLSSRNENIFSPFSLYISLSLPPPLSQLSTVQCTGCRACVTGNPPSSYSYLLQHLLHLAFLFQPRQQMNLNEYRLQFFVNSNTLIMVIMIVSIRKTISYHNKTSTWDKNGLKCNQTDVLK